MVALNTYENGGIVAFNAYEMASLNAYENGGSERDSFPIGVSIDSCPLNGLRKWRHLIRSQLVLLDCGPQKGVIKKIYNLLHHVLG